MENSSYIILDNRNNKNIKEYIINYNNKLYRFLISKSNNEKNIIISSGDYKIELSLSEIIRITKIYLETIDEACNLIINLFNSNKIIIKELLIVKIMKLSLKIYNNIKNKEEDILLCLKMDNNEKEKIINDIYHKYNLLQNDVIKLKEENNKNNELINLLLNEMNNIKKENLKLKNEIKILKSISLFKLNEQITDNKINERNLKLLDENNYIINKYINNYKSPNSINTSINLIKDAYSYYEMDNTFIVFNSLNDISHIIYVKENNSIIDYNLTEQIIISEIKKAHEKIITGFNYYLDKQNKIDLIMSISAENCNIKIWNLKNWECISNLKEIYLTGCLFSSCFINDNNNIYIVTSNCAITSCPIKIYSFKEQIKIIDNSNEETYFIDVYYEDEFNKIYIVTGNKGFVKSYDYYNNQLYKIYYDKDLTKSHDSILVNKDIEDSEIINLIDSCQNGFISIWNFHTGLLIHKINIGYNYLEGICFWNKKYLFAGGGDNSIKLIEIKSGLILKSLIGHKENVLSIKKNFNKKYGECIVSLANDGNINIWISKV